ncbi:Dynamin central region [Metarhizium brunneum]
MRLDSAEDVGVQLHGQRDVLDVIDSLRSQGISRYVNLPQIIVCGDQSAGKSSVLEAISGLSFPTQDALCTRFATELILRRCHDDQESGIKISIIPGSDRLPDEREKLAAFTPDTQSLDMGDVIGQAKSLMGLTGPERVFSSDILRVEISSPNQPHLTLVDLPGLFLAGNKDQSVEDSKLVESLVLSYMEQPRSIILAVVSAKSEFALQQVTQRARELDPDGGRTLGLITKPDTLHEGSESEKAYFELAQNKDVRFRLGWHVLRNRDFDMRNASLAERDAVEKAFFSRGIWASLSSSQLGINALRARLSSVLHDQILSHLPKVLEDIQAGISECKIASERLGASRPTASHRRRYLLHVSQEFSNLVKAATEGNYFNRSFFGDSDSTTGYERRLRAQVQNTLAAFAQDMRLRGHTTTIVDDDSPSLPQVCSVVERYPRRISRDEFVVEVNCRIHRNRGRELPGTFNPLIVGELFSSQCRPWARISANFINKIMESVRTALLAALGHVADESTANQVIAELLSPALANLERSVDVKLTELLFPHTNGHPITYNHYLTENIQKAQLQRHKKKIERALAEIFVCTAGKEFETAIPATVMSTVLKATEPNMDNYASMTAIDTMQAYYKVGHQLTIPNISG